MRQCACCGREFTPRMCKQVYCSTTCSKRHYNTLYRIRNGRTETKPSSALRTADPDRRPGIVLPANSHGHLPGSHSATCRGGGPPRKVFNRPEGPSILAQALAMMD